MRRKLTQRSGLGVVDHHLPDGFFVCDGLTDNPV
jgi:hypothetical protein